MTGKVLRFFCAKLLLYEPSALCRCWLGIGRAAGPLQHPMRIRGESANPGFSEQSWPRNGAVYCIVTKYSEKALLQICGVIASAIVLVVSKS